MKKKYIWVIIPIILFSILYEMTFLGKVPTASDTLSIKPISKWVQEYEDSHKEMPQWYPHVFSGMPSYGSYIYTPGSPINNLLGKILVNRGWKYWFYFVLGGLGVFVLLRRKQINSIAALYGGLVFSLSPYLFGLINAGHSSKIVAIGFIPWVFLGLEYLYEKQNLKGLLLFSLATALQLWSNHPQVVYYTWMLIVFRWVWLLIRNAKSNQASLKIDGKVIVMILLSLVISLSIVSDPYTSVYELQKESNRGATSVLDKSTQGETQSGTSWNYATQWSFHPKEVISFIFPYFYGLQNFPTQDIKSTAYWGFMPFTQSTHYFGLLPVLLAFLGLIIRKPDEFKWFMMVSIMIILIIGFGKYFPVLYKPLFNLAPFFSKFRVPSMIYLLLIFTGSVLGALGLNTVVEALQTNDKKEILLFKKKLAIVFGSVILLALTLLLFGSSGLSFLKETEASRYNYETVQRIVDNRKDYFDKGLLMALFIAGSGFAAIWFAINKSINKSILCFAIALLTLIDLWSINNEFLFLKHGNAIENRFRPNSIVKALESDKTHFRIFPIDEQNSNWYGYFGITSITGYRPVKLRHYQDLMDANGFANFNILNMLNVKYILSKQNINHPNFRLLYNGPQKIYQNTNVLPKAWFVQEAISVNTQEKSLKQTLEKSFNPEQQAVLVDFPEDSGIYNPGGMAEISKYDENRITINTNRTTKGILVLSEIYYKPGWIADIDGHPTEIYQTNHVLRSIVVPAGKHEIVFRFDASSWQISHWVSRCMLALVLIGLTWVYRNNIAVLIKLKKS